MMKFEPVREHIYKQINEERDRQDKKWGYPQKNSFGEWGSILAEETGELCKELNDLNFSDKVDFKNLHEEAIQVAAVAVSIIEHISVAFEVRGRK